MIKNERLLIELHKNKIIEKEHSELRSGKHSDTYIRKTKITLYPKLYKDIIYELAAEIGYQFKSHDYDIITGPAVVGLCFASPLSFLLDKPLIFPEKDFCDDINKTISLDYKMEFRPEYRNLYNKRVIIIEDIITTGESVAKTARTIAEYGGIPIVVFCIWKRNSAITYIKYKRESEIETIISGVSAFQIYHDIPIYSLINEKIIDWQPNECPICNPEPNINNYGENP